MSILIGVPTLNGPDRLDRCLCAIEKCTNLNGVKVLVCDDGSTPENLKFNKDAIHRRDLLRCAAGLELLVSDKRAGIAASWNKLTRHQGTRLCALINDDVEVVPHWLDVLTWNLDHNPAIGMIGLNTYLCLTKAQHEAVFPGTTPHERIPIVDYNEARLLDNGGSLISTQGSCFAFRRADFDAVGGFDERYFVYFEEIDFAVSLRKKLGLLPFIANYPFVFHQGGATNSDPANLDAAAHMQRSRQLFEEKWGKSVGALRDEFRQSYSRPTLREWSTQIHNWK